MFPFPSLPGGSRARLGRGPLAALVGLVALAFAGCTGESQQPSGRPTELLAGESPLDAMCRIREEFALLRKPVLRKVVFHEETTKLKQVEFHLHRKRLAPYYEFRLTKEARGFVANHTRAELVASLLPMVTHPTWGGEVAVLLMGMPARNREEAHYRFSRPSILLEGTGYRSPADPGNWGPENALAFMSSLVSSDSDRTLYQPRRKDVWKAFGLQPKDPLGHHLQEIVFPSAYLSYPYHGLAEADGGGVSDGVRSWLQGHPAPPLRDDARALVDAGGLPFTVLALFPRGLPRGLAVHGLDLRAYWPLVHRYPDRWVRDWKPEGARKRLSRQLEFEVEGYKADYQPAYYRRFYETALSACPDGAALREHAGSGADGRLHAAMVFHPPVVSDIAEALAAGAAPGSTDASGVYPLCTVLARSAWAGPDPVYRDLAERLLDAGAEPTVRCSPGTTAYIQALRQRNWEVVELIERRGWRLGHDEGGGPVAGDALAAAIRTRDETLLSLLLEVGVHPDAERPHGGTALAEAITLGNAALTRTLLAHGADPLAAAYVEQITRLEEERNDLLDLLIAAGASVNGPDPGVPGPLYVAAMAGRVEQTRRLLAAGADPNTPGKSGKPLVALLQYMGQPERSRAIIDLLLEAGANPSQSDPEGQRPLSVAARRGDAEMAARLKPPDTVEGRRELAEALAKAVSQRDARAVGLLVKLGAHPGGMNARGMSLLEEAARRGAPDVMEQLLAGGASPDVLAPSGRALVPPDTIGLSPWRYPPDPRAPREPLPLVTAALLAGNVDVLEPLIHHGADLDRLTGSGLSPLLALASARPGTLKVGPAAARMVQAGADLSLTDGDGYTVLTRAAEADRLSLLAALAGGGADLNTPDRRGRRVVEILAGSTFQTSALGDLLELGLVPTDAALDRARARQTDRIVRVFERAPRR